MSQPILRQLSIAMTPEGMIGSGDKLLFTNAADLNNFQLFTMHTVMIVGRKTAQQMMDLGVNLGVNRPMVVVSESGVLENVSHRNQKFISYAKNLPFALKLAEDVSRLNGLNGYTVCGGKRVYEDFLELLDKGKARVNRAYMFTAEIGDIEVLDPVMLSSTAEQIRLTIINRQADPALSGVRGDVGMFAEKKAGDPSVGETLRSDPTLIRGKDCTFALITDAADFDTTSATYNDEKRLKLKLATGVTVLRTDDISHWAERPGVNSLDIYMKNGQMIDARPGTIPGLNWIKAVLNKIIY